MTDEIDEGNNYPLWVRHDSTGEKTWQAPVYHSGFARKKIYEAYDSWYMRKNMVKSQEQHLEGYELSIVDKVRLFWSLLRKKPQLSTGYPQASKKAPLSRALPLRGKRGRFTKKPHILDPYISPFPLIPERLHVKLKVNHEVV